MSTQSGAGAILATFILLGGLTAYWFTVASHFVNANQLNFSYTSFLPVYCSIATDNAADVRQTATVYFWQGNIRIDLRSAATGEAPIAAHEITGSGGTSYIWRDDRPVGELSNNVTDYPILSGVAPANDWFCFPWLLFDHSQFIAPKNVTFQ